MTYLVSFIDFNEFFLGFRVTVLVWMPKDYRRRRHQRIVQGSIKQQTCDVLFNISCTSRPEEYVHFTTPIAKSDFSPFEAIDMH